MPTNAIASTSRARLRSPSGEPGRTLKGEIAMLDYQTTVPGSFTVPIFLKRILSPGGSGAPGPCDDEFAPPAAPPPPTPAPAQSHLW